MLIGVGLTKFQYEYMRMEFTNPALDVLPTHRRLISVKETCYPKSNDDRESGISVGLQELSDHRGWVLVASKTVPDLGIQS